MENRQLHTRSAQAHADGRPLLQLQNLTIAGGVVNLQPRPVATGKRQHEDSERCPAPRINKRQRVASKSPSPAPCPEPPIFSAEPIGRTPTATPGPQFEAGYCPTPGNTVLTRAARLAQKKQQQRRGQQAQRQQQKASAATSPAGNAPASQPPLLTWPQQPQHHVASAAVRPFGASAADWNFAPTTGPAAFAPQAPAAAAAASVASAALQTGQQQQQQQQQLSPVLATMPPPAAHSAAAPVPMAHPPQRRSTGPRRTPTPEAPAARTRGRSAAPDNNDNGGGAGGDSSGGDSGSTTPTRPQQRQLRSGRTRGGGGGGGGGRQAPATPSRASGNVAKILDIMRQQLNMRGRDIVDVSLKLHSYSEEQLQLTEGTLQLLLEEEEWEEAATYLRRLP